MSLVCGGENRRTDSATRPPAPIATETPRRIAELYRIEADIRGTSTHQHRAARQQKTGPLVEALKTWLETTLTRLPSGSTLEGHPLRAHPMGRVHLFLDDGRIEIDFNTVEQSVRQIVPMRMHGRESFSLAVCRSCSRSTGVSMLDAARGQVVLHAVKSPIRMQERTRRYPCWLAVSTVRKLWGLWRDCR
jgi:hypothetical protein